MKEPQAKQWCMNHPKLHVTDKTEIDIVCAESRRECLESGRLQGIRERFFWNFKHYLVRNFKHY